MSKLVRVSLLDPVLSDDMVLVPIRWEATGRMGLLFPVLDANLMVGTDSQGRAELRITGAYRPPLDGLGEGLDRAGASGCRGHPQVAAAQHRGHAGRPARPRSKMIIRNPGPRALDGGTFAPCRGHGASRDSK